MNIGDKIKKLRIEKDLSQEQLGALIGVKKAAIHKYETGIVVNLKQSTIAKLAEVLGTTPAYLISDETPSASIREEKDIEKILAQAKEQLMDAEGLMFDGDPASPEAIESILSAMKIGIAMAKEENKKYIPKKYRKD